MKNLTDKEFEQVIFENQLLILKICSIYCESQADKDDLFQEIMINLWKGLRSYRGESKLSTWIYRVGLNTAISGFKKRKRSPFIQTEELPEHSIDPKLQANQNEEVKILYHAISMLKPICRLPRSSAN